MLLRQTLSRSRPALARRARQITLSSGPRDRTPTMLLRQALSRALARQTLSRALARRSRQVRRSITHREEGRKLPREMVAAMTADGDASSYYESMRSRVAASGATRSRVVASGATRAASSAAGDDYVALADEALDTILEKADELSDERDDVEAELSSGVLTLKIAGAGTWVINKQVPNRQLWLSSPVSGPCRYEYVEGTWTHTRDGSSLAELLERELGLIM